MKCYSRDQLRGYLLRQLDPDVQDLVDEHINTCEACCQILDELASDDMLSECLEASRREDSDAQDITREMESTDPSDRPEVPEWQPFCGDDLQLPVRFDRFILKEPLGSGGFGIVYRADDINLEREVAVKIPHLGGLSNDSRQRFLQEGTAAANLHHPNIVQVHQSGTHRGVCFLVSEFCPGRTLRQWMDDAGGIESAKQAARIMLPLTEAVAHAHRNGIVHRDIKPANVILDSRGAKDGLPYCPKLTDFGTARFLGMDLTITTKGILIGTASYMSPEQAGGSRDIGIASDIYSLGVLLYELVAGKLPIKGVDIADTIHKITTLEPPLLHHDVPGIPLDLSAICICCLEKTPTQRYATADDLADDLRRFLNDEPTKARPLGPAARAWKWSRRNPLPLGIMATICMIGAIVNGGFLWHTGRLREVNERLETTTERAIAMKDRAEQSELHALQLLYGADIRLAAKSWRAGDLKTASDVLSRYEPDADSPDLRGIEWYFLQRALQPKVSVIAEIGTPLYCIRLSPDRTRFATAGQDGRIRVFDRFSGDLLVEINSGQGEVNSLAFSPDGQSLASAGDDGSIRLWRSYDGEPLDRIQAHDELAFGVVFITDSSRMATCSADKMVHVWKDGERLFTFQDHTDRIEDLAISPDGRWLASVGKDLTLAVRDLQNAELHFRWDGANGKLPSAAFSPDSKTVAIVESSGNTKYLRLFDIESKTELQAFEHSDGMYSVAFSPDGKHVLTTDNVGTVRVWRAPREGSVLPSSEVAVETWQTEQSSIYCGIFEPGGTSVLTVGPDGNVERIQVTDSEESYVLKRSDVRRISGVDFGGTDDGMLSFNDVRFHSQDRNLLVVTHAGVAVVHLDSDEETQFRSPHTTTNWQRVATPQDGQWVAIGGSSIADEKETAAVACWDPATGPIRTLFRTPAWAEISDLTCSPAGDVLAVVSIERADRGKQLTLLDAQSGEVLKKYAVAAGTKSRFTRDGRSLVYCEKRDIHIVDLETFQRSMIRTSHVQSQSELAISRDGRWIATSAGRDLEIRNFVTQQRHAMLEGHQGNISALVFSSDSRTLVSSSFDGTVKAWSVATGQPLMDLHRCNGSVNGIAISSDGSQLAIIEESERVLIYPFD